MTPRPQRSTALAAALVASALLGGCQTTPAPPAAAPPPTDPAVVGEFRPGSGYVNGYLDRKLLPDSLALLPPAPAPGSALAAADLATYRATRLAPDSARWKQAAADSVLRFPAAADAFSCALDMPVSAAGTPHLNMLLRRTMLDAGLATYRAKDHYQRPRPFVVLNEPLCTPAEQASLSKDGSYPSGHAALAWAWALVLAELAPDKAPVLLARGIDFGQSRVVCGVHWQSDVDAGRLMGAATVARLHADPVFIAQAAAARSEIDSARRRGLRATLACPAPTLP